MLRVDNLHFSYAPGVPVLRGVDLTLRDGEVGVLLGQNGSGKTTLFNCILGALRPQAGRISLDGEDLRRMPPRVRAGKIAYVPQDVRFGALSVYDSVLMGRVASFGFRAGRRDYEAVERVLEEMGLTGLAHRSVEALSGGERRKISVARALAQEPALMVFDEPTGNLDMANEQLILKEARRLAREKRIAVLTSLHDLNQALYAGDRFLFLKDGRIRYDVTQAEMTAAMIRDVFDIDARIVDIEGNKYVLGGRD